MRRSLLTRLERLEKRNPKNGGFLLVPTKPASLEEWARQYQGGFAENEARIVHRADGFSCRIGPIVERHRNVLSFELWRPS